MLAAPRVNPYHPVVKGWLTDAILTVWAMFYWNTRKSIFRLRGRRSPAPCQNPSDSGQAMKTGCDACASWHQRARFRRVCPLLKPNEAGVWVCSVNREDVRPFWGRVGAAMGSAVVLFLLLGAITVYSGMRVIGYQVTWRQVLWPPAWSELRGVRADLFIQQARASYAAGDVRDAIHALTVAYQLNPTHYQVAMMLAQFHQAGSPQQSDRLYLQLMHTHPEHRAEIARAWFQGLLARGRLDAIAELAKTQLPIEPGQAAVWSYALLFAARHQPELVKLDEIADTPALPPLARAVLGLAARVQKLAPVDGRGVLLATPLDAGFPFDRVYRVETLIRLGYPQDALALLAAGQRELAGRDVARLALSAYAQMGNRDRLKAEFSALLAPTRKLSPAEITLLAVHLVHYPDREFAAMLIDALYRLPKSSADTWMQAAVAVFCAAGVAGDEAGMNEVKDLIRETYTINMSSMDGLKLFFLKQASVRRIESILPSLNPLSIELNYALLDRYL